MVDAEIDTTVWGPTYRLIRRAVIGHRCLTAVYGARVRHFCPHAIGLDRAGTVAVLGLQYAGGTSTSLPPGGDWRCFRLLGLSQVARNPDRWRTKPGHSQTNSCVVLVDAEAYASATPKLAKAAEAPIIARLRRAPRKGSPCNRPGRE